MTTLVLQGARLAAVLLSLGIASAVLPAGLEAALFPQEDAPASFEGAALVEDATPWLPDLPLAWVELDRPGPMLREFWTQELQPRLDRSAAYRQFQSSSDYAKLLAGIGFVQLSSGLAPVALLEKLGSGRVSVALLPRAGSGAEEEGATPSFALVATAILEDSQAAEDLLGLLEKWSRMDESRRVERAVHRGVHALRIDDAGLAAVGRVLLLTSDQVTLQRVLERAVEGPQDSAAVRFVQRVRDRCSSSARIRGYARPVEVAALLGTELPGPLLFDEPLAHLLLGEAVEGLARAKLWRLEAESSTGEWQWSVAAEGASLPAEQQRSFPSTLEKPAVLRRIEGEGIALLLDARRDLGAWWHDRSAFLDPSTEQGFAKFETDLGPFFPRSLGDEILPELVGDWQFVIARQHYAEDGSPEAVSIPAFALVVPAEDAGRLFDDLGIAVTSLIGILNVERSQQRQAPWRIYTESPEQGGAVGGRFDLGRTSGDDPVHYNVAPCVARAGEFVVLATSRDLLARLQRALTQPATSAAAVQSPALDEARHTMLELEFAPVAGMIADNREFLVAQSMVSDGKSQAEAALQWDVLEELARMLHRVQVTSQWQQDEFTLRAAIRLNPAEALR